MYLNDLIVGSANLARGALRKSAAMETLLNNFVVRFIVIDPVGLAPQ